MVIATGGFERNDELKRAFLRGPCTHTVAVETNEGDGLKMAMRIGAMLGNMREAWWMPMIELPTDIVPTGQQLLTYERTLPGAIMVNRSAKRFTNEAANYNAFGAAFHEQDTIMGVYRNLPCWLVFDQQWLDKYGFAGGLGGTEKARTDWITSSDTVKGLGEKLGIDGDVLEQTVERFNANARDTARSRLQAGLERAGQVVGRSDASRRHGAGVARSGREPAVLRDPGVQWRARDEGRPSDRHPLARARRRRRRDPRAVRRRERDGLAARDDVRRRGWHARAGDGVRLPRGTGYRRAESQESKPAALAGA